MNKKHTITNRCLSWQREMLLSKHSTEKVKSPQLAMEAAKSSQIREVDSSSCGKWVNVFFGDKKVESNYQIVEHPECRKTRIQWFKVASILLCMDQDDPTMKHADGMAPRLERKRRISSKRTKVNANREKYRERDTIPTSTIGCSKSGILFINSSNDVSKNITIFKDYNESDRGWYNGSNLARHEQQPMLFRG